MDTFLRHRIGDVLFDSLVPKLLKYKAVMAGGMIVQTVLRETWANSDIDIYVTEENFEPFLRDCSDLTKFVSILDAPNYHNSFMKKNNVRWLASFQRHSKARTTEKIDIPIDHWDDAFKDNPRFAELGAFMAHSASIPVLDMKTRRNVITIQIMCINKGVSLESVIGSYDLTFCQVLFDGKKFRTCGDTTMEDILAKRGRLADDYYKMYNYTLHKRIVKYMQRGFEIVIDWDKIARLSTMSSVSLTNEDRVLMLFQRYAKFQEFYRPFKSNLVLPTRQCRHLESAMSFFKVTNLITNYPFGLCYMIKQVPQIRRLVPQFIDMLKIGEYREVVEQLMCNNFVLTHVGGDLINIAYEPAAPPPPDTNLDNYLRKHSKILHGQHHVLPEITSECILIGSSAIARYLDKPVKPIYLQRDEELTETNGNINVFNYAGYEHQLRYIEYDNCIMVYCKPEDWEVTIYAWPVPNSYYDGTRYYFSESIMTSTQFTLQLGWSRYLRKHLLITHEFQSMINLGYQYIPTPPTSWGMSKTARLINLINFTPDADSGLHEDADFPTDTPYEPDFAVIRLYSIVREVVEEIVSVDQQERIIEWLVSKGIDPDKTIFENTKTEYQKFTPWVATDLPDLIARAPTLKYIIDNIGFCSPVKPPTP
jgi:hypothetical protein